MCVCGCGKRQKYTSAATNLISSHRNMYLLLHGVKVPERRGGEGSARGVPRLTGTGVLPEYTEIRWEIQFLWNILKLEVWLIDALIAPLSTCPLFTVDSSRCGLDSAMGQCAQRGKKKNPGRRENIILLSLRGLLLHANRVCS